jgi:hypothetical protein
MALLLDPTKLLGIKVASEMLAPGVEEAILIISELARVEETAVA